MQRGFELARHLIRVCCLIGYLCSLAIANDITPIQQLDAITARHENLHSFLADQKSIDEYFDHLQTYMGPDKVKKESFDAIINQLRKTLKEVPAVADRLWETKGTGEKFSIKTSITTYGRKLENQKWMQHLSDLKSRVEDDSKAFYSLDDTGKKSRIEQLVSEISVQEQSLELVGTSEQKRNQTAEHFKKVRSLPQVKELAAHYTDLILSNENINDLLNSGDPDLILDTVKSIKDNPRKFLAPGTDLPGSVISEIKELLPDQAKLLANSQIFPHEMRQTNKGKLVPVGGGGTVQYDFVPVPRRFHGIWKGIPIGECVAGNCKSLDWLTPKRWATIAIADSQVHYLEKGGYFSGFVEAVPGEINGKTVASVSFGAPDLRKKIILNNPDGTKHTTTLYEEWLKKSMEHKPSTWSGFVVSTTNNINNAGVLGTVRSSRSYVLGETINPNGETFHLKDPIVKDIVKVVPVKAYADGNMILDATTTESAKGPLTLLTKATVQSLETEKILITNKLNNPALLESTLQYLQTQPDLFKELKPEVMKLMSEYIKSNEIPHFVQTNPALNPIWIESAINELDTKALNAFLLEPKNKIFFTSNISSLIKNSHASPWYISTVLIQAEDGLKDPENVKWLKEYFRIHGLYEGNNDPFIDKKIKILFPLYQSNNSTEILDWLLKNPKEINSSWISSMKNLSENDIQKIKTIIKNGLGQENDLNELKRLMSAAIRYAEDPVIKDLISKSIQKVNSNFKLTREDFFDIHKFLSDGRRYGFTLPGDAFPSQFGKYLVDPDHHTRKTAVNMRFLVWKPIPETSLDRASAIAMYLSEKNFQQYNWNNGIRSDTEAATFRVMANSIPIDDPKLRELMLLIGSNDKDKLEKAKRKLSNYRFVTDTSVSKGSSCVKNAFKKFLQPFNIR